MGAPGGGGSQGLLKFAGTAFQNPGGPFVYLSDGNSSPSASIGTFIDYPIASPITCVSFATEISAVVPDGGGVDIQLFHNGVPVPSFITGYNPGETGVKVAAAVVPEAFAVGDTMFVRVFTFNFDPDGYWVTATIGTA